MLALEATTALIELGSTNLSEYTDPDDIPHASVALSPSLAPVNTTLTCQRFGADTDGVFTAVGDISANSYNMRYTYSECWVNDTYRFIGAKTLVGTSDDNNLATLTITTTNYNKVGQYMMNTSALAKFYTDGSVAGLDILLNGKIDKYYAYNAVDYINKMGFENFHYVADVNGHENIDGKVSVTGFHKSCADGIYTLETLEKIVPDGDGASAGKIKVNGATYQFNNDGSVGLTFADGSTDQYMFVDRATAECPIN